MDPSLTRIVAELRSKLSDLVATTSDAQLKHLCDLGATKSLTYGITTEHNVYRFIAAMLFFGKDFDTDPKLVWTKDFLFDPQIEEDHKARLLELRIAIDTGRGV